MSRGIKCENRKFPRQALFSVFLFCCHRVTALWCVRFFSIALNPQFVPLLWARVHSACLSCYFAFSLSSVFFPISNYLLVSEVQPRIFHGISPTSSSPFGHCWMFRGESRVWHVCYMIWAVHWKAIQLPVPWHGFFPALWPGGTDWLRRKYGSMLRRQSGGGVCALALAAGSPTNSRSESNVPLRKWLFLVFSLSLQSR